MINYRKNATLFFNAQTGQNNRAWADACAAYFSQLSGERNDNYVDALNAYYGKLKAGTINAPVTLTSSQVVVSNAGTVSVRNSAGANAKSGTAVVSNNTLTGVNLPANTAMITSAGTTNVPIKFTTARTAGATATVQATYTVANGVITAITIA